MLEQTYRTEKCGFCTLPLRIPLSLGPRSIYFCSDSCARVYQRTHPQIPRIFRRRLSDEAPPISILHTGFSPGTFPQRI